MTRGHSGPRERRPTRSSLAGPSNLRRSLRITLSPQIAYRQKFLNLSGASSV
jgi:hypothetical protein